MVGRVDDYRSVMVAFARYPRAVVRMYMAVDEQLGLVAVKQKIKAGEVEKPEPRRRRTRTVEPQKEDPSKSEVSEDNESGDQGNEK